MATHLDDYIVFTHMDGNARWIIAAVFLMLSIRKMKLDWSDV